MKRDSDKHDGEHGAKGLRERVRRGGISSALIIAAGVVIVIGATGLGIEVSHALGDPNNATATASTGTPATLPPSGDGDSGSGSTSSTLPGPSQTQAPVVNVPGGSIPGFGSFNAVTCTSDSRCLAVRADDNNNAVAANIHEWRVKLVRRIRSVRNLAL